MSADSVPLTPSWMAEAACRGCDPALFYSERGSWTEVADAKRICRECPVKAECLEYGLREPVGIWGGKTVKERRRLYKSSSKTAQPNWLTRFDIHS